MILPALVFAICAAAGNGEQREIFEKLSAETLKLKDCYENNTKETKPSGKMSTRFTIGPNGKASNAVVLESELKSLPVEACVVSVLNGLTFPAPADGGSVQVDYPLVFSPEKSPSKSKKKK